MLDLEQRLWEAILNTDEEFEVLEPKSLSRESLGLERTEAYWEARKRRVARLREQVNAGHYHKPAEWVAEAILWGRPKWGEALVTPEGDRVDEVLRGVHNE